MKGPVHFRSTYGTVTACGLHGLIPTSGKVRQVTCTECMSALKRSQGAFSGAQVENMVRIKVGDIKRLVKEAITTSDGKTFIEGDPMRIERELIRLGVPAAERKAIMKGTVPIGQSALNSLIRAGVVKRKPRELKPYDWDKENRAHERKRAAAEKKLDAAYKKFASNWTNFTAESPDISPEDAAMDAALGFFYEYPEWREWARLSGRETNKQLIQTIVAEYVYEAMTTGSVG